MTALAHFALAVALSGAGACAARPLTRNGGHCVGAAAGLAAFFGVAIPLQIPLYHDVVDGYFALYALPMAGVTACVALLAALALSKPSAERFSYGWRPRRPFRSQVLCSFSSTSSRCPPSSA